MNAIIELLKNRMMTLTSAALAALAWAEAEGVGILEAIGSIVSQAEGTGAGAVAAITAALVAFQNALNKK